jgi:hypothetical protein
MHLIGMTKHCVYVDDCEGVHPDVIQQYYGIRGHEYQCAPGQTGAGHPPDEDWMDLGEQVAADQSTNVHHEAVEVPGNEDPFSSDQQRDAFRTALAAVQEQALLPHGYGLHQDEWETESYPAYEIMKSGWRGTKELRVALPNFQWQPRAELWGQALDILNHIKYMYGNE